MISKAVILCGGAGTRLRSVVSDKPKVLAPINGKPFLDFLLRYLEKNDVFDIVLATGYKGEQVETFIGKGTWDSIEVRCVREESPLGTGGALVNAIAQTRWREPFFVVNGDTFFTGSIQKMSELFGKSDHKALVAIVRSEDAREYGRVRFDTQSHLVTEFTEKGVSVSGWINAGVYILQPSIFVGAPVVVSSFENDWIPGLVEQRKLAACPFPDDRFLDYGTPGAYRTAGSFLAQFGN